MHCHAKRHYFILVKFIGSSKIRHFFALSVNGTCQNPFNKSNVLTKFRHFQFCRYSHWFKGLNMNQFLWQSLPVQNVYIFIRFCPVLVHEYMVRFKYFDMLKNVIFQHILQIFSYVLQFNSIYTVRMFLIDKTLPTKTSRQASLPFLKTSENVW